MHMHVVLYVIYIEMSSLSKMVSFSVNEEMLGAIIGYNHQLNQMTRLLGEQPVRSVAYDSGHDRDTVTHSCW